MSKKKARVDGESTLIVRNPNSQIHEFVTLDTLPDYIRQSYDANRLGKQTVDFAMSIASGEDMYSAVDRVYNIQDKNEQKRKAKTLLRNPKVVDMIAVIRETYKSKAIIDVNNILVRLEMVYSEAVIDEQPMIQLMALKQMASIVANLKGDVNITNTTIKFELPNIQKVKEIEAEDITEEVQTIKFEIPKLND